MALILIIDDSIYQRRVLRRFVELQGGHQAIEAANGREGLEIIATHKPDCVLLDLIMPGTNGFELLEQIQQLESSIPMIVITADVQTSTHKQCLELGAAAVINKPVDSEQLQQILDNVLSARRKENQ
ncbi:MAG: response regulator [Anaerolineae bacterium]|nr:response regulator [Anaerolineae bacterium]